MIERAATAAASTDLENGMVRSVIDSELAQAAARRAAENWMAAIENGGNYVVSGDAEERARSVAAQAAKILANPDQLARAVSSYREALGAFVNRSSAISRHL